jgi:hypothetical protein
MRKKVNEKGLASGKIGLLYPLAPGRAIVAAVKYCFRE